MPPLVSIIVPCYNAEKWIGEAIESGLRQSYPNIEVIVVDDGSTDGSLGVLKEFAPRIKLETGPNRGGNHARNAGFALSTGEYVQYLDADDYLATDKIARQVEFLERTEADVVYGDWRYRRHLPDSGVSYLDKVEISGEQPDILVSLLSGRWWVFPGAVLYRRSVVDRVNGWDESLRAAQDRDFFTSVALSGARIRYQPGCYSFYRKYGATTVSSSDLGRWIEGHCASLRNSENALARTEGLLEKYKGTLALGYFEVARGSVYTVAGRPSYKAYARMLGGIIDKIAVLGPQFTAEDETYLFRILQRLVGLKCVAPLLWLRLLRNRLKMKLRGTFLLRLSLRLRRTELQRDAGSRPNSSIAKE